MNKENQEIERKFLIAYPSAQLLSTCRDVSKITQTYLSAPPGITARVRKREWPEKCEYTHTEKRRMSDMRRLEFEQEISAAEYAEFLKSADPAETRFIKSAVAFCWTASSLRSTCILSGGRP